MVTDMSSCRSREIGNGSTGGRRHEFMAKRFKSHNYNTMQGHAKGPGASGPQRIDDLLSGLLARQGYAQLQQSAEIESAWCQAAGAELAALSRPAHVRRGVLEVIVQNSAALQELMFQKSAILEKLTQADSGLRIEDLRFRVGAIK